MLSSRVLLSEYAVSNAITVWKKLKKRKPKKQENNWKNAKKCAENAEKCTKKWKNEEKKVKNAQKYTKCTKVH